MIAYNKKNIPLAKIKRKNMTPQERKLWHLFLKTYPVRFQRQKAIGNYIVDFYCAKAKLIVELDGTQHYMRKGQAQDAERTAYLEQYGLTVLRFANNEVTDDFEGVCEKINLVVEQASWLQDNR